jgi:predicted YcjX-like family ATPase
MDEYIQGTPIFDGKKKTWFPVDVPPKLIH